MPGYGSRAGRRVPVSAAAVSFYKNGQKFRDAPELGRG
jgi:hypothetical protein